MPTKTRKPGSIGNFRQAIEKEREKDPEFYEFLKSQDAELLNFDVSEEEIDEKEEEGSNADEDSAEDGESDSNEEDDEPETDNEKIVVNEAEESKRLKSKKSYKGTLESKLENLEESSDEDVESDVDNFPDKIRLTKSMVKNLEKKLDKSDFSIENAQELSEFFKAVVEKSGATKVENSKYCIVDSGDFNLAISLCFKFIPGIWVKTETKSAEGKKKLKTNKPTLFRSKSFKPLVKEYLSNIIMLLQELQEKSVLIETLVHVDKLTDVLSNYPRKSRLLIKVLIKMSIEKEDSIKRKSFQCILSIVQRLTKDLFMFTFKRLYLAYSKLGLIKTSNPGFNGKLDPMQFALGELCSLDPNATYQNAFIYIREMGIKLRTLIQQRKMETMKEVYCKSFINRLYLWSVVLNKSYQSENLAQLIYPLTQIVIGSCKYADTAKLIPFRIHTLKCLLILSENSKIHTPILALIADTLAILAKCKIPKKPVGSKTEEKLGAKFLHGDDLDRLVKFSTSQLCENSFIKSSLEQLTELFVQSIEKLACLPSFLEATYLPVLQIKKLCRGVKNSKTGQKQRKTDANFLENVGEMRQIVAKIDQHQKWLAAEKQRVSIDIRDAKSLLDFETSVRDNQANSLLKYCASWRKLEDRRRKVHFKKPSNELLENDVDSDEEIMPKKKRKKTLQTNSSDD